ncbi:SDR family NAD(P)-dependent oxidoreductase [Streptomyces pimonensis]|uniref:SDR family NAD(P)-dependent oxidoreductase n=1 Tax=Streptomyces pimonensis TaxID=2860288 RepID=A0ABV4J545_9ACTN
MKPNAVTGDFRVTRADVAAFAEAGGDRSPLHVDEAYARRTPFGQPVAHGALCVLQALALLPVRSGLCLTQLRARFPGPVYPDQAYRWEAHVAPDNSAGTVSILDGRRALAEIEVRYAEGTVHAAPVRPARRRFAAEAAGLTVDDLVVGAESGVRYRPDWPALGRFVDDRGIGDRGVGVEHAAVLAWASQLAGMETPGRAALVGGIDADFEQCAGKRGFSARAVLADVDPRYRSVRLTGDVTAGHTTARVEVRAFARRETRAPDPDRLRGLLEKGGADARPLKGRTAVVCGGSRGLGAALVQALAVAGATVHVAYRDGTAEAEALVAGLGPDGTRVHLHRGDVGDPAWCTELRRAVHDRSGTADLLILNAGPPARPMDVHPDTVVRSGEHVAEAMRLAQASLAAFADHLTTGGLVVTVSSAYAHTPHRGLSHYTAAKRAVEGLTEAVVADAPGLAALVVRPPRLATTFADSVADDTALDVEPVAAAITRRIAAGVAAGTTRVLSDFDVPKVPSLPEPPDAAGGETPDRPRCAGTNGSAAENARAGDPADSLVVAATFTTDPLHPSLAHWCERLGLDLAVRPAAYGQVFQELLDPASAFAANRRGCNVVLLRVEDWPEGAEGERTVDEFCAAARTAAARLPVPLLVALCPPSPPAVARRGDDLEALEERLLRALDAVGGVHAARLTDRGDGHWVTDHHDAAREEHAHIPYTPEACTALGTAVVRLVHALLARPYKVLVLDCDNTLWRGVCAEDGPLGVELGEAHRRLQEWAVRRHDEGVLVCLASKNTAKDVDEVFRLRPEMPLRPEHIAARRVDWNAKAANIEALARELGVGLDSFVFLDDNPVEVAAVRAATPQVLALGLPAGETDWDAFLARLWAFDRTEVTDEDRRRTEMYRAARHRAEAREEAPSLAGFIEGLGLRVDVHEARDSQLARVAQLTQRTNQFNLAPLHRTETELRGLLAGGARCWVAEVADRFGDYGLVGAALTREEGDRILLDTFLLSCRVLGRGVEHAFLSAVARALTTEGGPAVLAARHRPTDRNAPARSFFRAAMGEESDQQPDADGAGWHQAPLHRLAELMFRPDDGPEPEDADLERRAVPSGADRVGDAGRRAALALLATGLTDTAALHHAVTGEPSAVEVTAAVPAGPDDRASGRPESFDAVRAVVSRIKRVPFAELTPDTTLESLRLESLEIVDATVALEKDFGRLPKTLFFEHRTLGSVARSLASSPAVPPPTASVPRPAPVAGPSPTRAVAPTPAHSAAIAPDDGIAVVGIAGRYPGADDVAQFWENLKAGIESLTDVAVRWEHRNVVDPRGGPARTYTSAGGLISGADEFDALFFQLAPSEAETMDPQQRLFLQTAYHAVEDAGHTPADLGRDVGVYVASMGPDYAVLSANAALDGHSRYPNSDLYQIANRVSYFMDFTGPSIAVDTACSGSGVALQLACDAIRAGTVSAALAGGVNLILHPARRIQYAQLGMVSRSGRCRPFGADADGMVTSEGVGAVLLRPLRDALADGDHVYGVIRAIGANSDGRTNGFTVPNPQAQADLIARTLRRAGTAPSTVGYVEAHGTGTPLGDPIEIRGLSKAYVGARPPAPIPVGSVKGNIGHTEAAAALAGLTKVLLQLRHRTLVPSLHSQRLNPDIDFTATPFRVQQSTAAWPAARDGAPRRAALSSFGAGGVNVHLVVEEAPVPSRAVPASTGAELVVLSSRDEQGLRHACARLANRLRTAGAELRLTDVAFTLREGREHFGTRLALVVTGLDELADRLERLAGPGGELDEDAWEITGAVLGRLDDGSRLDDVFDGTPGATDVLRAFADRGELDKLARLWCQGARLDWSEVLPSAGARRVSLPGYPFARTRHWLPRPDTGARPVARTAPPRRAELYVPDWIPAPSPAAAAVPRQDTRVIVVGDAPEWSEGADHRVARPHDVSGLVGGDRHTVVVDRRGLDRAVEPPARKLQETADTLDVLTVLADEGRSLTYVTLVRPDRDDPAAALTTGFGRALEREAPGFRSVRIETDADEPDLTQVLSLVATGAPEIRAGGPDRFVRAWAGATVPAGEAPPLRRGGHYVVTGGGGGVGRLLTAYLVEEWAARVTWVSRSGEETAPGGTVRWTRADATDPDALAAALSAAREAYGPVNGVFHAAGVLNDGAARTRTPDEVRAVLAPKTWGCLAVDEATADDPLDFFMLMSSFVGTLGNAGQTSYCAANRFLDAFAEHRAAQVERGARSGRSVSVAWPLWSDGGMDMPPAVRRLTETTLGLVPIDTSAALTVLEEALVLGRPRVLVGFGDQEKISAALGVRPAPPRPDGGARTAAAPGDVRARLRDLLRGEAAGLVKVPAEQIGDTTEFGDYGFNSLLFTDFANRLNDRLGLSLTPVVFYQHSTVVALTSALLDRAAPILTEPDGSAVPAVPVEHGAPAPAEPAVVVTPTPAAAPGRGKHGTMPPVAVIGMAGRLPGSPDLDAYWTHLIEGHDLVTPGPAERFGVSVPAGGFLDDILGFDAEFFAVSPREARLMDPQQRLFLEAAWHAVEDAALRPSSLAGSRTGVFVGATLSDYADLLGRAGEEVAAHSITGHVQSVIANRLSYLLDLRGPSEVVDTACSSSLTALHRALGALEAGECDLAVAGGVNALFSPAWFDSLGQAGMLSPTGRCWTFDERADGFVRGEGVGVVVLKLLDRALADGDPIRAVVRGSAVNHGGRAHSLTAPRPEAQAEVVTAALNRAGVAPRTISYVETHGTGTRLGDPIEIAGLTTAFERSSEEADGPWCHLGAVKANIGHLESAAGVAGLLKVLLALGHRTLPPNAVGERANPHLRLDGTPFRVLREPQPWRPLDPSGTPLPLRAGVSAFGFGGANAHLVVEEPPAVEPTARPEPGRDHVLVLSALDDARLRTHAQLLRDELRRDRHTFADLAHTSRVARDPMPARLALVAPGSPEAVAALDAYLDGRTAPGLHTSATRPTASGGTDLHEAARRWVAGEDVSWPAEPHRRRVPFPARPFDHSMRYGPHTLLQAAGIDGPARTPDTGGIAPGTGGLTPYTDGTAPDLDAPATRTGAGVQRPESLRLLARAWTPAPAPAPRTGRPSRPAATLVLVGAEAGPGLAEELAGLDGHDLVVLREPSPLPLPCARTVEADLDDREETLRAVNGALAVHGPFDVVIDAVDALASVEGPPRHAGRLALLQELLSRAREHPVTVVHVRPTAATRSADQGNGVLAAARTAGCVRALGAEYSAVTAVTVEYDALPDGVPGPVALAAAELAADPAAEPAEIRYTHGTRRVGRLEPIAAPAAGLEGTLGAFAVTAERPYVITGGTGGLGIAAAELLVARGARRLALIGRRALPPREQWAGAGPDAWWKACTDAITRMEAAGAMVLVGHGAPDRLAGFLDEVRAAFGTPAGVLHCAGAVSPTPAFVRKDPYEFDLTWEPKGPVLAALDRALGEDEPDFVVLYSSVSARMPRLAVGLSDYAAANAALDDYAEFAEARARHQGSATRWLSLAWGSWSGVGMGEVTTPRYAELGLVPMSREEGLALLDAALATQEHTTLAAVATRASEVGHTPTVESAPGPAVRSGAAHAAPRDRDVERPEGGDDRLVDRCADHITDVLAEVLGTPRDRIAPGRPFADLGVDSILIASIVVRLEKTTGAPLDPSVVLEHPTVERLARHLVRVHREGLARWAAEPSAERSASAAPSVFARSAPPPAEGRPDAELPLESTPDGSGNHTSSHPAPVPSPADVPAPAPGTGVPLAVIGMAGRFPGAADTAAFWDLLCHGRSGIREVPRSRWDVASRYSPEYAPGMSISKWGGYLDGIEDFDAAYFGIPEADAAHVDPLIRLFLETAETAIADAGYRGEELNGRAVGVFVGSGTSTYASRIAVPGRATATGLNQNFIAAHLAHLHNLRGPNLVVDTACSSSLSSLHLARQALQLGECEMAIVGGADLLLDETPYLALSAAHALSPDGRCHVFDASANGFVPGEGVGAVLIKPLAAALADGDRILAVIESTAMNNDGRTMGLTTPSPDAQQAVVREALRRAGADPASVSYVEAHGTGTMIGDPMELRALTSVFAQATDERQFCGVGSVKSNVGHLLMAAGMAGLQKIVLSLQHQQLPPTLHCDRPNPRFAFETSPLRVQDRLEPWRPRHGVRRAGLSAFGFGGTNCHVVLREPVGPEETGRQARRTPLPPPVFQRRRHWVERTGPDDPPRSAPRPLLELEELI